MRFLSHTSKTRLTASINIRLGCEQNKNLICLHLACVLVDISGRGQATSLPASGHRNNIVGIVAVVYGGEEMHGTCTGDETNNC